MIISSDTAKLEHIVRDVKKFTSKQIIKVITENPKEGRKEWMLNIFSYTGKNNNNNKDIFVRRHFSCICNSITVIFSTIRFSANRPCNLFD